MDTYFDVLPQDIISVILIKIENVRDFIPLNDVHNFRDVISKPHFWSLKTKLSLPNINFKYIPTSLLDFNKSFKIKLINYATLMHSYKRLTSILLDWQNKRIDYSSKSYHVYHLSSIINLDLLRLDLLSPDQVDSLVDAYSNLGADISSFGRLRMRLYDNDTCNLEIKIMDISIKYYIPKIDALNFLTYAIFNNLS